MPLHTFKFGQTYTREQIHAAVGGGLQTYLPRSNGRVVCGCFKQTMNPTAPEIVLVGDKPNVIRDAELFAAQREAVPVFIKQQSNHWEYVGDFAVERYSRDPAELQPLRIKVGRPHAIGVLFLRRVR